MNGNASLETRIAAAIGASGRIGWLEEGGARVETPAIPFRDYMAMCLYDGAEGYYGSGAVRVGRDGDFYTSAGIGTLMGEMLAAYIAREAESAGLPPRLLEWGAGTGRLAAQMLTAWRERFPRFADEVRCVLVDGSETHRKEAARTLEAAGFGGSVAVVMGPEEAEAVLAEDRNWILLANELLDAFPVHRVAWWDGRLWELGAACRTDVGFRSCFLEPDSPKLAQALAEDGIKLAEGQEAEIGLDAAAWLRGVLQRLPGGLVLLIDYGGDASELAAPHRMRGTLMAYHRHRAHDDPFQMPGRQDLTAHVNFSACRRIAEQTGWRTAFYGTQKQFLVECGILEELRDHRDPDPFGPAARRNRSIRQLLLSDGMSESFKVLVLRR